jgi:hypothetical protein
MDRLGGTDYLAVFENVLDRAISEQASASIETSGINETHMKIFESLANPDCSPHAGGVEFDKDYYSRLREVLSFSRDRRKRKRYIELDEEAKIAMKAR